MGRFFAKKEEEKQIEAPKPEEKKETKESEPEIMLVTENQLILNELNKVSQRIQEIKDLLKKAMEEQQQ